MTVKPLKTAKNYRQEEITKLLADLAVKHAEAPFKLLVCVYMSEDDMVTTERVRDSLTEVIGALEIAKITIVEGA